MNHDYNAEAGIDALIERRTVSDASGKQQELEDLWAVSEQRDRERRRRENRALWYEFHMRLHETHARNSKEHEVKALTLLEDPETNGFVGSA